MPTRWQPFTDIWREMNRLQQQTQRPAAASGHPNAAQPLLDVWQDEEALYLEAELPGVDLGELEILVTGDDQLSLKGARRKPADGQTYHRQERGYGPFSRLVALPFDIDDGAVEANLREGVLTIKLPKREEAKPRKITVTSC